MITLNSISDLKYSNYVYNLLNKLFKIKVAIRKRPNQNALVLVCSSTNLVDFLVKKGSVKGNKVFQQIDIPDWINNDSKYKKAFVRGLVDTDGCLFIHNHVIKNVSYRNIGFCFTNSSKKLIISVSRILKEFGIGPHITDKGRRIYLYSFKEVLSYLNIFGSSDQRICKKYLEWLNMKKDKDSLYLEDKVWRGSRAA